MQSPKDPVSAVAALPTPEEPYHFTRPTPMIGITEKDAILVRMFAHLTAAQARELAAHLNSCAEYLDTSAAGRKKDARSKRALNGAILRWGMGLRGP